LEKLLALAIINVCFSMRGLSVGNGQDHPLPRFFFIYTGSVSFLLIYLKKCFFLVSLEEKTLRWETIETLEDSNVR
jgi:hypothetical protein